jgi:hypothetical protein
MKERLARLILISVGLFTTFVNGQDQEKHKQINSENVKEIKADYDSELGITRWRIGQKMLHESSFKADTEGPSISPDGTAGHFGSFKSNSSQRLIVAFYLKGGAIKIANENDLPDQIQVALFNAKKVPSDTHIDKCWIDPVRWIDGNKLLINAELVSVNNYEVSDFQCLWNIADGSCEYLSDLRSDKEKVELIKPDRDNVAKNASSPTGGRPEPSVQIPKDADLVYYLASATAESYIDIRLAGMTMSIYHSKAFVDFRHGNIFLEPENNPTIYLNDTELKTLDAILEKYGSWQTLALRDQPDSFEKNIPCPFHNLSFTFVWTQHEGSVLKIQYYSLTYPYSQEQIAGIREMIKLTPTIRTLLNSRDKIELDKKKALDEKFK